MNDELIFSYDINIHHTIESYLGEIFKQAFERYNYPKENAVVSLSARPELGQFQCNGAMPCAKVAKKAPFKIAEEIITNLDEVVFASNRKVFADISVVKPGFINITVTDDLLSYALNQTLLNKRLGCYKTNNPQHVFMDFGGPNVAKPLHIGHIRSPLIGDCLQRVYRFCGDKVTSDVHLGDWGTQMGMLIEEIKLEQPGLPYFDEKIIDNYPEKSPVSVAELNCLYPQASKRCKSDPEAMNNARQATFELQQGRAGYRALWRHFVDESIKSLKQDYKNLGVSFDLWLGESDVQSLIEPMVESSLASGTAVHSEGAIVIPVAESEEDKTPPLILLKSDGAVMYGTTDLATIVQRVRDWGAEKIIYVVDKRQSLHFKQVFKAAKRAGIIDKDICVHIGFGTLNGADGKPFKTRDGGVMQLSTLIEEAKSAASLRHPEDFSEFEKEALIQQIALATVKFADLSNPYSSDYVFDIAAFSQYEGKTGPYLLYTAVRIKSILRKLDIKNTGELKIMPSTSDAQRALQLCLSQLSLAIQKTYERCEPHHLCDYAYRLAVAFNKFYAADSIIHEKDEAKRQGLIALSGLTLKHFELVLNLLGMTIPDRM